MWQPLILALFQAAAPLEPSGVVDAPAAPPAAEAPGSVDEGPPIIVEGELEHETEGRIICRREVPTGSIMPRRVCRTEALIDAQENFIRRGRMKPNMPARGPNGGFLPN